MYQILQFLDPMKQQVARFLIPADNQYFLSQNCNAVVTLRMQRVRNRETKLTLASLYTISAAQKWSLQYRYMCKNVREIMCNTYRRAWMLLDETETFRRSKQKSTASERHGKSKTN